MPSYWEIAGQLMGFWPQLKVKNAQLTEIGEGVAWGKTKESFKVYRRFSTVIQQKFCQWIKKLTKSSCAMYLAFLKKIKLSRYRNELLNEKKVEIPTFSGIHFNTDLSPGCHSGMHQNLTSTPGVGRVPLEGSTFAEPPQLWSPPWEGAQILSALR